MDSDDFLESFGGLLNELEQQRKNEEEEIARLTKEVAYMEKVTAGIAENIKLIHLDLEEAVREYKEEEEEQERINNKIDKATPILEEMKDHLIAAGNMIPGCAIIQEYLTTLLSNERQKIDAVEAELTTHDDSVYEILLAEVATQTNRCETEKKEQDRQIAQLRAEIEQIQIDGSFTKKKMAAEFELEIKKWQDKNVAIDKRLKEEKQRGQEMGRAIVEKKEHNKSLEQKIAEVDVELAQLTVSFTEQKSKGEEAQMRLCEKLSAKKEKLEAMNKTGLELLAEKNTTIEKVTLLENDNKQLCERIKQAEEAIQKGEAELVTLEEQNASLEKTVECLASELDTIQSETSESEQKDVALKKENKDLNEVLESNRKNLNDDLVEKNQQIAEMKAKLSTIKDGLNTANEAKIKYEELQGKNEALVAENEKNVKQNEEMERKIALDKQNLDETNKKISEITELFAEARCNGNKEVAEIEAKIEETTTLLEKTTNEVAELKNRSEKLSLSIEKEKELLTQEELDSEKRMREVKEQWDPKIKEKETELEDIIARKNSLSIKLEEHYNEMKRKLESRNLLVAENERNLALQFSSYAKVQESIVNLQNLLAQAMENDSRSVARKMRRQLQRMSQDNPLPGSFSPTNSSTISSLSSVSSKSSEDVANMSSEDIFESLLRQSLNSGTSKTKNSQISSQNSTSAPASQKSDESQTKNSQSDSQKSQFSSQMSSFSTPPSAKSHESAPKTAQSGSQKSILSQSSKKSAENTLKHAQSSLQKSISSQSSKKFTESAPKHTQSQKSDLSQSSKKSTESLLKHAQNSSESSATQSSKKSNKSTSKPAQSDSQNSNSSNSSRKSKKDTSKQARSGTRKSARFVEKSDENLPEKENIPETPTKSVPPKVATNQAKFNNFRTQKTSNPDQSVKNPIVKLEPLDDIYAFAENSTSPTAEATASDTDGKAMYSTQPAQKFVSKTQKPSAPLESTKTSQPDEKLLALSTVRIYSSQESDNSSSLVEPLTQVISGARTNDIEIVDEVEVVDLGSDISDI